MTAMTQHEERAMAWLKPRGLGPADETMGPGLVPELATELAAVERETKIRTAREIVSFLRDRANAADSDHSLDFGKGRGDRDALVTRAAADAIEREWLKESKP